VREFATTRHGVPAGAALRAAGCRNVGALMRREAAAFARHAGAEPTRITFRALESVTKNWTDCYGFVADARSAMAAGSRLSLFTGFRGGAADESIGLSETAIALMDEAAARIDAAGSDAEIAKVWQMTLAGTAGLNELDAATVSAFVDVGQSSYDYWNGLSGGAGPNGAINATGQMSLYPTEPTVRMGLAADLAGCYGVVRFTRFLIGITGPQASVGLCAGGAAVASGAYLYQAINQT